MKRKLLSIALLAVTGVMALSEKTFSQEKKQGAKPAFDKGSKLIGISAGFGLGYGYYGNAINLPAVAVNYDHGIVGNVGPGTIGIGGVVGLKTSRYKYDNGNYKATWANIVVAARATYHLTILKDKNNKFDPYAGVTLGLRFHSYNDTYYNSINFNPHNYNSVYPVYGLFVGARYNFTNNFGAFSELGYDISFFRIGLAFGF